MKPNPDFRNMPKEFWANIRSLSQELGYTHRGTKGKIGQIKVPTLDQCRVALESIGLTAAHLIAADGTATEMGGKVLAYFTYRADILNRFVEPLLMNAEQAEEVYQKLMKRLGKHKSVPMNKQSGDMKKPAFFTGIINMLIGEKLDGLPCDYGPQELTTITLNKAPFRTLARRIDGAFPTPVDPIAVWEIKEYYYTTTFGSRVADGVYETLLDGMELEELNEALRVLAEIEPHTTHIQHLLMIDAHFTWWIKGRSYLCRIIDMLNMGYVDEVLFGREVVDRLPLIVAEWVDIHRSRQ